jgi:hypothetical protein
MSICKNVNQSLELVEFISTNKKDAEVERDELDAIMRRKDYTIVRQTVYIVISKENRKRLVQP